MQKITTRMTILGNEDGNGKRHIIREEITGYNYLMYNSISVCIHFDGDYWGATDCATGYAITPKKEKRSQVIKHLELLQNDIKEQEYREQQKRAIENTQKHDQASLPELREGIKYGIYDNGGKTWDRYTLLVQEVDSNQVDIYGLSSNAMSPQGFNQYSHSIPVSELLAMSADDIKQAFGVAVPYIHADADYPNFTAEVYQAIDARIMQTDTE